MKPNLDVDLSNVVISRLENATITDSSITIP